MFAAPAVSARILIGVRRPETHASHTDDRTGYLRAADPTRFDSLQSDRSSAVQHAANSADRASAGYPRSAPSPQASGPSARAARSAGTPPQPRTETDTRGWPEHGPAT